jgi:dynein heavy chain, axonemal
MYWTLQNLKDSENMHYSSIFRAAVVSDMADKYIFMQPLQPFITKMIQLYEMIVVRHGLMLVGWSFSMKTSCLRILAAALTELNKNNLAGEFAVKTWTLNPKSISMGQLYGEDDPVSKEWQDGVLAVAFRTAARCGFPNKNQKYKWIPFGCSDTH